MTPETVFTYAMLTLSSILLFAIVAAGKLILEIRREAAPSRERRKRWSELFASAQSWLEQRKANKRYREEFQKIRPLRRNHSS
jgi:hypothetical protein